MKYLKQFESVEETKDWISKVMDTCKDIMLELEDAGIKTEVKRSLKDKSVLIECLITSNSRWNRPVFLDVNNRLIDYMTSEGFELVDFSFGNQFKISFKKSDIDSDYIGHLRYLKKYNLFENRILPILLDLENNVDSNLINKIESLLPSGSILEISCGNGADAIKLNELGYDVVATDFTKEYVDYVNQYLPCIEHDTRQRFPFGDKSFDLVYSRLGLHYFSEEELMSIFTEISRLTKKYLVFTVKLANDNLNTGKVILGKEKWEELVSNKFNIISSEVKEGILYTDKSKWLEIIAEL